MSLTLFTSDHFADHLTPPGHPERVARAEIMQVVASEFRSRGGEVLAPLAATSEHLARVHDPDYLSMLREVAGRAVALDADTYTSPQSYDVAMLAAGAAVGAVEHVLDGPRASTAFALVRPPGHHAERNRAMGFCLFNNIAIAAAHARAQGLERVAIVDYDVHHGNGTQWSFYDDPSVLFVSSHQYPFYPGTGAAADVGRDRGQGFTVNLPLEAGAGDADYDLVYRAITWPIVEQFKPQLILVSAGFDAFKDDPIGGMRVTAAQFERLTAAIVDIAGRVCDGRVVAVLEGGYDIVGLGACIRAAIAALEGHSPAAQQPAPAEETRRADACIAAVRPNLARFWTL